MGVSTGESISILGYPGAPSARIYWTGRRGGWIELQGVSASATLGQLSVSALATYNDRNK
jgi:hypothetical protein